MPEGDVISSEALLPTPVEETRRFVLTTGVPQFAEAKYKLVSQSDNTVVLARRYLPGLVQRICILVIVLVVIAQYGATKFTAVAALGWVAILVMLLYRRQETLTLDLRPEGDGTRVIAVGNASKKGRAVIANVLGQTA
jgi:hypothetical protein